VNAFVALGGNSDGSGAIVAERLEEAVEELGLTLDVATLMAEIDSDGNGTIDYDEFSDLILKYKEEESIIKFIPEEEEAEEEEVHIPKLSLDNMDPELADLLHDWLTLSARRAY
jgi:hypothetical protein